MQQAHIYYKGSVQGVGFRWRARKSAESFNLTGWVKNLPDGRVELLVQGNKNDITGFIDLLDKNLAGYILQKDINWQPAKVIFKEFEIRF
jgi:acylphosphatase